MSDPLRTAVVTGAGRGFGRAISAALVAAGTRVVGIARTERDLRAVRDELGDGFTPVTADATDESVAQQVVRAHRPGLLVLNAGATPHTAPLHEQTWETFSRNWHTDTRHAFTWTRAALRQPLAPGSVVVTLSSGAVLAGSPLSGGYAGAKATQRFMTAYAQEEATRAGLDITFAAVLPQFAPMTGVGRPAVQAYAARAGQSVEDFLDQRPFPLLSPEVAGAAVADLLQAEAATVAPAYVLNGAGLQAL